MNPEIEFVSLISRGRLFHMTGAHTKNAREAKAVLARETVKRPVLLEHGYILYSCVFRSPMTETFGSQSYASIGALGKMCGPSAGQSRNLIHIGLK